MLRCFVRANLGGKKKEKLEDIGEKLVSNRNFSLFIEYFLWIKIGKCKNLQ